MNTPKAANTKLGPPAPRVIGVLARWRNLNLSERSRLLGCLGFIALLIVVFFNPLLSLVVYAAKTDLDSHILLVPFISAYLIYIRRKQLPKDYIFVPGLAMVPLVAGLAAFAAGWGLRMSVSSFSHNDFLSLMALSFICFLAAGGFLFLGRSWMAAAAFPVAFLIFMVPLPDRAVDCLETAFKLASAEAAALFFNISSTPVLRDGLVFQLPGVTIEVAQECSGIHSSWVLFITSLLASYLFLKSPWRRAALIALVIPLGILRNGFRVFVIGTLCVRQGPQMIHSAIHTRGGPLFFVLSLVPLSLFLWWLRRAEANKEIR